MWDSKFPGNGRSDAARANDDDFHCNSLAGALARTWATWDAAVHLEHGVDGVAVLVGRAGIGQQPFSETGEERHANAGSLLDAADPVADPPGVQVQLGQHQASGGFAVVAGKMLLRKDPAEHLVGAPADGRHGGDAQPLVNFGAAGIVDPRHHVRHMEGLAGHAGGQDVGVVAAGDSGEGVGLCPRRPA